MLFCSHTHTHTHTHMQTHINWENREDKIRWNQHNISKFFNTDNWTIFFWYFLVGLVIYFSQKTANKFRAKFRPESFFFVFWQVLVLIKRSKTAPFSFWSVSDFKTLIQQSGLNILKLTKRHSSDSKQTNKVYTMKLFSKFLNLFLIRH